MAERKMTMEERIQAFYKQSGGPSNRQIQRLLEEHLRNGKDHGMPGRKETFEDAFKDAVYNDPSLLLIFHKFQQWKMSREHKKKYETALEEKIERIENEIKKLTEKIESYV